MSSKKNSEQRMKERLNDFEFVYEAAAWDKMQAKLLEAKQSERKINAVVWWERGGLLLLLFIGLGWLSWEYLGTDLGYETQFSELQNETTYQSNQKEKESAVLEKQKDKKIETIAELNTSTQAKIKSENSTGAPENETKSKEKAILKGLVEQNISRKSLLATTTSILDVLPKLSLTEEYTSSKPILEDEGDASKSTGSRQALEEPKVLDTLLLNEDEPKVSISKAHALLKNNILKELPSTDISNQIRIPKTFGNRLRFGYGMGALTSGDIALPQYYIEYNRMMFRPNLELGITATYMEVTKYEEIGVFQYKDKELSGANVDFRLAYRLPTDSPLRHDFRLGTGFFVKYVDYWMVGSILNNQGQEPVILRTKRTFDWTWGVLIYLDYDYTIANRFFIGLRGEMKMGRFRSGPDSYHLGVYTGIKF